MTSKQKNWWIENTFRFSKIALLKFKNERALLIVNKLELNSNISALTSNECNLNVKLGSMN